MKTSASATVIVTLSVPAGSSWGPKCDVEQVHRQAIENVRCTLERIFRDNHFHAKIVGAPKVQIVLVDVDASP